MAQINRVSNLCLRWGDWVLPCRGQSSLSFRWLRPSTYSKFLTPLELPTNFQNDVHNFPTFVGIPRTFNTSRLSYQVNKYSPESSLSCLVLGTWLDLRYVIPPPLLIQDTSSVWEHGINMNLFLEWHPGMIFQKLPSEDFSAPSLLSKTHLLYPLESAFQLDNRMKSELRIPSVCSSFLIYIDRQKELIMCGPCPSIDRYHDINSQTPLLSPLGTFQRIWIRRLKKLEQITKKVLFGRCTFLVSASGRARDSLAELLI